MIYKTSSKINCSKLLYWKQNKIQILHKSSSYEKITIYIIVNTTIKAEIQARQALLGADRDGITDRVWRAKGTLTNAYRLSSDECMELIALVKMGVQMDVIEGDVCTLDKLSIMCQPASLTKVKGQPMTPEDRDKFRAEYIRQNLK